MTQPQLQPVMGKPDFDSSLTRSFVPLKDMSDDHLKALLDEAEHLICFAGQVIFQESSHDDYAYYLIYGDVRLSNTAGVSYLVKGRSTLLPIDNTLPHLFTAVAEKDSSLLKVNRERLDKLVAWSQVADNLQLSISRQRDLDEDADWMMTVLKSNLFFKVPPINVNDIFSRLEPMVVYAGDVIVRQGEIGDQCYFIKEGEAEVWKHQGADRKLVASIGVGRCFGEDALVNETVRNASIVMKTDGVLMRLSKNDFYRLLKEPEVPQLRIEQLAAEENLVLVDARSPEEYAQSHIKHAVNIPLSLIGLKSRMLDDSHSYIFYCDTGRRSKAAVHLLQAQGFNVKYLQNGYTVFSNNQLGHMLEVNTSYLLRSGGAVAAES